MIMTFQDGEFHEIDLSYSYENDLQLIYYAVLDIVSYSPSTNRRMPV